MLNDVMTRDHTASIRAGLYASAGSVLAALGPRYTGELKLAFPDVDPGYRIFGYNILCQMKMPRKKAGGLILPDESKDVEKFRTQAALVRAMGPSSFHRRDTLEPWPEGAWCIPGMFVRVPMYGGDRFEVDVMVGGQKEQVLFALFKDTDLIAERIGDPLSTKTS